MYGSAFYNPFMYQPYYQAARMAGSGLGGLAGASASNLGGAGISGLGSRAATAAGATAGVGRGLLSRFSFSGLLNGASRTLNVVNQAIPIFYQVRPMINNAKTMFRIMGAVKEDDTKPSRRQTINQTKTVNNTKTETKKISTNNSQQVSHDSQEENPTFFI